MESVNADNRMGQYEYTRGTFAFFVIVDTK